MTLWILMTRRVRGGGWGCFMPGSVIGPDVRMWPELPGVRWGHGLISLNDKNPVLHSLSLQVLIRHKPKGKEYIVL